MPLLRSAYAWPMKLPKSLSGVTFVSFGVAATVALSACGGSAPASNTAAVRTAMEQFEAASYAGAGNTLCSLMTPASRRLLVQLGGLFEGGRNACAAAITTAITNNGPQSKTLAQTDKSLAGAHVVVTGDAATITLTDSSGAGGMTYISTSTINLVRVNGKWLLDLTTAFGGGTLAGQTAKTQTSNLESQEALAYQAAHAATLNNATTVGNYDTGTALVSDITTAQPGLKGIVTAGAASTLTPTDGLISVAETTTTAFVAVGMTASGQTVTYTAPNAAAPYYNCTSPACPPTG